VPDKKTILLVEDEAIIRMNEAVMLKEQGYEVIGVSSGEKAIQAVRNGHGIDLVLMDLNLGRGMDGTKAAQEILRDNDIPIIFLSVHTEKDIVERIKGISSYGYVVKDSGIAVLDASIKMAFSLYETRKELQKREEALREALHKRKTAEDAFRMSEGWFRKLYESMRDAYAYVDMSGRILRYNTAFRELIGYDDDEITGLTYMEITPEEWHGLEGAVVRDQVLPKGYSTVYEKEFRRKDGSLVPVELRAILIQDGDGRKTGIWGIIRDISERKAAEKALIASKEAIRRSEEKYRNIFENALEGIFQATFDGGFISVNPALARIYGFDSPAELIDSVKDIARQLYRNPEEREAFLDTLRKNGAARTNEVQAYKKDGSIIWVSVSARLVRDETGHPVYYEGTVEDITKRKSAEMSLRSALAELESKNKELAESHAAYRKSQEKIFQQEKMASIGQLAAGVAHEINNPTGFIISNLNSLNKYMKRIEEFIRIQADALDRIPRADAAESDSIRQRAADERKKLKVDYLLADTENLISESLDGSERIKRIVQDLKGFSRADDAGLVLADINESLESTLNIVWNEVKYKAVVRKEYGEIPCIRCNPRQLSQVFMNILVNASQAIPESGEITIKTWHDDRNVCVAISDTGVGIPVDKIKRIFEPFYTTKAVGQGTGLGLSIAYDIVKKHSGEIEVASKPGEGTTFMLRIPRTDELSASAS